MKKLIMVLVVTMMVACICEGVLAGEAPIVEVTVPTVEQLAKGALAELINTFVSTKDFILEQAPIVLHELLRWKFAISLLGFIACVFTPIMIGGAAYFFAKKFDSGFYALNLASLFVLIPFFECNTMDWLQIWLAPRVYLIEYTAELLK